MKIAVLTDSGSGLSKQEANELGIYFLPLQILHQDTQYFDGESVSLETVYELLHEKQQLTTSMPPIARIEETLQQIKEEGYDAVVCVPITSGLSSTAAMIHAAAENIQIPLHMIECYATCFIQCYLAKCAKQLVDQGLEVEEIVRRLQDSVAHSNTLIIPDDLQHLKRGGRLTPVAAALGGLLKIKPILELNAKSEGKIDVFDKVRTMSKAQMKAIDTFVAEGVKEGYELCCIHTDAEQEGLVLQNRLHEAIPDCDIYFGKIGAVISVHTGIGCLGIQYIKCVEGVRKA